MRLQWALRRGACCCAAAGGTAAWVTRDPLEGAGELPLVYDPEAFALHWQRRPGALLRRCAQIGAEVLPRAPGVWRALQHDAPEEEVRAAALELREGLTRLGPAFIKLGQMLSSRPDLLPPPFLTELRRLCDAVPPFPSAAALAVVEQELGRPAAEVFEGLDETSGPVAAASLGQVYRCRLRSTGEEVAVKVQRPDMAPAVALDLHLMRCYARAVEAGWRAAFALGMACPREQFDLALLDTFAAASFRELDYRHEARSQERFRRELVPRMRGRVHVPRVHGDASARRVLTTEWVHGEQLALSPPRVIERLVPVGVECFIMQLLDLGFFHSDPHPGNLLVTPDGRLALIDFGLCAEVPLPSAEAMTTALLHLLKGDVGALLGDAVVLGFLPADVDLASLKPAVDRVFEKARLTSGGGVGVRRRRRQFGEVSRELNRIFFDYPFRVPDYFALVTRALIVLEGIALTGNSEFDIFAAARPHAARRAPGMVGSRNFVSLLPAFFA
eukprot:TRINITY_DN70050_c0_g1_i1.p1 TRINITY_DN70050_c0_g1~~TRINITY_DN70050_c0_g1_i1.p1  ORF type:complete len:501 (+),score=155.97 TRINITY_DN70050_c0_g1_i1:55-1557(+)